MARKTEPAPEPDPDDNLIDPARIRDAFTSRELGDWELAVGLSLSEFKSMHMSAMLAWWGARQDGDTRTPDEFLDLPLGSLTPYMERATELLGKAPTGESEPSGTSSGTGSASLQSSPISTPSPSPSLQT
jgi:hypothetical protein